MGIPLNNQTVRTNTSLNLTGSSSLPTPYGAEVDPVFEQWLATPIDHFQFDTTPTVITPAEGLLRWSANDGTLNLGMAGGDITMQIGQETYIRVKNSSGSDMFNGQPVYIVGADPAVDCPTVELAWALNEDTARNTVGLLTVDVPDGEIGFCTVRGHVHDINTSGFAVGDRIFVGETPGTLVNGGLSTHAHTIAIGRVVSVGLTDGDIVVTSVRV